jgi:hypothetical protein
LVDTPALILSQYCRVGIIIGDSSVCLDMLAGGVPVIMYFRNEVKCFNRNYLNLGLVAEAHTMDELKDWIIKLN